ncbi:MAG: 30S ribosomal protein S20 [Chloroflexota bacterium]
MANIQSQIKRNRQNEKRRLRNRDSRGAARTAIRDALAAMTAGNESQAEVAKAITALDKAARKGAIHHRNAARRKSRLIKRLAALGQRPGVMPAATLPETAPSADKKAAAKSGKRSASAAETKAKPEAKKAAAKPAAKKAPAKKAAKK